jgi:hypothetical protein
MRTEVATVMIVLSIWPSGTKEATKVSLADLRAKI